MARGGRQGGQRERVRGVHRARPRPAQHQQHPPHPQHLGLRVRPGRGELQLRGAWRGAGRGARWWRTGLSAIHRATQQGEFISEFNWSHCFKPVHWSRKYSPRTCKITWSLYWPVPRSTEFVVAVVPANKKTTFADSLDRTRNLKSVSHTNIQNWDESAIILDQDKTLTSL